MIDYYVTVGGNDYTDYAVKMVLTKRVIYANDTLVVTFVNDLVGSDYLYGLLGINDDVVITDGSGTKYFTGIIQSVVLNEDGLIVMTCQSNVFKMAMKYVKHEFISMTASEIVKWLIDNYFSSDFTYTYGTSIQLTTKTYTKKYVATTPAEIINELVVSEQFMFYVDVDNVAHFKPFTFNDTGYDLSEDDVLESSMPKLGNEIKNLVYVIGKSGTPDNESLIVVVRDDASISKYGVRPMRLLRPAIDTTDKAFNVAYAELRARSEPAIDGRITLDADTYSVQAGDLIWLSFTDHGWSGVQFLITESKWELFSDVIECRVLSQKSLQSKILSLIEKSNRIEEAHIDFDAVIVSYEYSFEEIIVQVTYEIAYQSVSTSSAMIEEGEIETFNIDAGAETWSTSLSGDGMLTNDGLNALRDMILGKSGTPELNASNTSIALGSDNTPVTVTQTALVSETIRNGMDSGFPSDGTDYGEMVFETTLTDTEVVSDTYEEFGLFNDTTSGTMITRIVPGVTFSKIADENLKVRVILKLKQSSKR